MKKIAISLAVLLAGTCLSNAFASIKVVAQPDQAYNGQAYAGKIEAAKYNNGNQEVLIMTSSDKKNNQGGLSGLTIKIDDKDLPFGLALANSVGKKIAVISHSTDSGLQIKLLNTQTMQPSAVQLLQIQAGTFTSNPAYVCPANPDCGTPNAPLAGTVTCPDICYVSTYIYNQCPARYAALVVGSSDLFYQFSPASNIVPTSQDQMISLQSMSYTCSPQASTAFDICPAPSSYQQNNYVTQGGSLWQVISTACTAAAAGVPNCNWGVSCGVANNLKVTLEQVLCTRPAGYYPVAGQVGSGNQTGPLSSICGLVNTQ